MFQSPSEPGFIKPLGSIFFLIDVIKFKPLIIKHYTGRDKGSLGSLGNEWWAVQGSNL